MDNRCISCGGEMTGPEFGTVPYRALPGVLLINVPIWTCANCGEKEVGIPKMNQLQEVLAHAVANKPGHLSTAEIRFLRKHLGWSGRDFAAAFDVTPETVSRWENGERNMSATAERLLRMCATRLEPLKDYAAVEGMLRAPTKSGGDQPMRVELSPQSARTGRHAALRSDGRRRGCGADVP
ncbi:MAG: helix-turn-helix domain-containing protein [Deltaproteobacteria bacterium]|nr:helix-turn-helix domain-containing protein [Deltaproteobacteria bacterium]